mmetsp:Transcript_8284/g.20456  ORF Transcript_8284/g.20456 Transcript_8284/m.20456 type:complete len:390 (+) Transcript_8284:48-1217(+)
MLYRFSEQFFFVFRRRFFSTRLLRSFSESDALEGVLLDRFPSNAGDAGHAGSQQGLLFPAQRVSTSLVPLPPLRRHGRVHPPVRLQRLLRRGLGHAHRQPLHHLLPLEPVLPELVVHDRLVLVDGLAEDHLVVGRVVQVDSRLQGLRGDLLDVAPLLLVVAAQLDENLERQGRVVLVVEPLVAAQHVLVLPESLWAGLVDGRKQLVDDEVLPAEGQRGGHLVELLRLDEGEGVAEKLRHPFGHGAEEERRVDALWTRHAGGGACLEHCEEARDLLRVRPQLVHRLQVHLEVAHRLPALVRVELVAHHHLSHQSGQLALLPAGGNPRQPLDRGQLNLEGLQEGHEVPNREHVHLREGPNVLDVLEGGVELVVLQPLAQRRHALLDARDAV